MIDAALEYLNQGFSVIPVNKKDKKPFIGWTKYQSESATMDDVKLWWKKYPDANIGIVTGKISNLCVVDADSSLGLQAVKALIEEEPNTTTPGGGWHWYFGMTDELRNKTRFMVDTDFRGEGGFIIVPPSIGANGKPYIMSGDDITDARANSLPLSLINLLKYNGINNKKTSGVYKEPVDSLTTEHYKPYKILQEGRRDDDLFRIGMALADGRCPIWMIRQTLEKLAFSSEPPFPIEEVENKIKSIQNRINTKDRNLAEEVREYFLLQKGYTFTTDILQTLQLTTKDEKKNLSVILVRLQKEGLIEKYGEKRGCYRPVDTEESIMQFVEDEISEYPIKLPFGLNDICSIYAKNIIMIAGTKSSGKTAILLDIAIRNMARNEVVYLNSEMGHKEWTVRLKNMGIKTADEIKFKGIECHSNFHDKINGGRKIYIIDYLEIHDNFFEIAKPIRQIHEKLEDGICIIALQKKYGQDLGRGAEFSMEKSRLYLTLDFLRDELCSKITIIDAKASKMPQSASGLFKKIKITHGSHIEVLTPQWLR